MGNDLNKNKPKTIADLNIKWEFSYRTYIRISRCLLKSLENLNPDLFDYTIAPNVYNFVSSQ
jgi:hypothetical protein